MVLRSLGKRLLRRLIYLSNLQDRIYSYKFSKVNVVRKGDSKAKYQEETCLHLGQDPELSPFLQTTFGVLLLTSKSQEGCKTLATMLVSQIGNKVWKVKWQSSNLDQPP